MDKPFLFLTFCAAAAGAQAFSVQSGEWQWPHTISWHDKTSNSTDSVKGSESICISQKSSTDYPKAQADSLAAENCKVSNFQSRGNKASFKAACETMSFDAEYEKLGENEIRFTQTIYSRKDKSYTASGTMRRKGGQTASCAE
ncbi:DUF3617 domain-containing protein [Neisseria canis]|uniref:Protein of uncharacterized function (DUF3617) n=1 Tax=Neisseria canis TaxID=493 RepID=A0A1X3CZ07_9NEIS|nr:DUF3617 family protein [Neisseria canis]OSI12786.1 hypothetical protein BWD07_03855 [Neisseria canis]VEF00037.1 Protein of uncharacterised function (DUF3617) [Neisseria canis]